MPPSRDDLIRAVQSALEPLPSVYTLFESGSAAFGRLDEFSDIDLVADVEEGHEDEAFAEVERALEYLAPIEIRWIVEVPAPHGMQQRFYRLSGTPPHLMVDLCFRPASQPGHYAEREMHGEPEVLFDKRGLLASTSLDPDELAAQIARRLETLRVQLPLLEHLVTKELDRGHPLDALAYYLSLVLRPLVEVLRIRYSPARHGFGLRYLTVDVPEEVAARLEYLAFVGSTLELREKHAEAVAWCLAEMEVLTAETGGASPFGGLPSHWTLDNLRQATSSVEE